MRLDKNNGRYCLVSYTKTSVIILKWYWLSSYSVYSGGVKFTSLSKEDGKMKFRSDSNSCFFFFCLLHEDLKFKNMQIFHMQKKFYHVLKNQTLYRAIPEIFSGRGRWPHHFFYPNPHPTSLSLKNRNSKTYHYSEKFIASRPIVYPLWIDVPRLPDNFHWNSPNQA